MPARKRTQLGERIDAAAGAEQLEQAGVAFGHGTANAFHDRIRVNARLLAQAQVVLIGGDGVSYGGKPSDAESWKAKMLAEVGDRLPLDRVHFLGRVPYGTYLSTLQVSRVHCYLTYPFVLSWSLTEAMAAGKLIVASDTEPVRELIRDGENGRLVGFFDRAALEAAGVEFIPPNGGGPGVRLKERES